MVVEREITNRYEFVKDIQQLDWTVLDVNTDRAILVFTNDDVPLKQKAEGRIKLYLYDTEKTVHEYRLEQYSDTQNTHNCANG